jgi:hypothetical protein
MEKKEKKGGVAKKDNWSGQVLVWAVNSRRNVLLDNAASFWEPSQSFSHPM